MKLGPIIALFVAAFVVLPLAAKEMVDPAVNANTRDAFEAVSTWVRKQMDPGGRYSYVTQSEHNTVNARLDQMNGLFQKHDEVAQMNDAEKLQLYNTQQEVNGILAKHDNDRLICRSENPTGSHIPVKTCQTAGEIEARRRGDRDYLQRHEVTPQLRSGG
jgi:hypothetical protein